MEAKAFRYVQAMMRGGEPSPTGGELAEYFGITDQSGSMLLHRLKLKGWLIRRGKGWGAYRIAKGAK